MQAEERKAGWKQFVNRIKTDPDMRMAMLQFAIGATQPAQSPAAGIGNALNAGMQTLQGLEQGRYERSRQQQADTRAERQVATQEGGLQEQQRQGIRSDVQFDARMEQQRKELEAQLEQIKNTKEYQQAQIENERAKLGQSGAGSEQGQVNSRWTRLRNAMLADPTPDLQRISDPAAREARAELMAFDLINKSGQDQAKFVANFLAGQQLFLPDPKKDPQGYADGMKRLLEQAQYLATGANLMPTAATPSNAPGAPKYATGGGIGGEQAPKNSQDYPPAGTIETGSDGTQYKAKGGYRFDPNNWEKVK